MFKSSRRPIVIPQSEHLKLAGTVALLWGNDAFEFPPLPRLAVVAGNALHDRGYGYLDNHPIGGMDDEEWFPIARRGFVMPSSDPIANTITRYHILRLLSHRDTPGRRALAQELRPMMEDEMAQHGLNANLFTQVDRMTDLCDRVSFAFCFEEPTESEMQVFARYSPPERRTVRYGITESEITLDPWPLQVDKYSGYLVGYRQDGYPERSEALIIPYRLSRLAR